MNVNLRLPTDNSGHNRHINYLYRVGRMTLTQDTRTVVLNTPEIEKIQKLLTELGNAWGDYANEDYEPRSSAEAELGRIERMVYRVDRSEGTLVSYLKELLSNERYRLPKDKLTATLELDAKAARATNYRGPG